MYKRQVVYFLPLLLIAGFVPLIVYAKYVNLEGTKQALYWTGQRQYLDFFSYWKSMWVVILTAIALIFYIILYKQKKLPFKNLKQYYIPVSYTHLDVYKRQLLRRGVLGHEYPSVPLIHRQLM